MRIRPEFGVSLTILADGRLEAYCEGTGERFRCGPMGTALWIALCQNRGDTAAAAATLAPVWQMDPEVITTVMDVFLEGLCDAGMVRDHDDPTPAV